MHDGEAGHAVLLTAVEKHLRCSPARGREAGLPCCSLPRNALGAAHPHVTGGSRQSGRAASSWLKSISDGEGWHAVTRHEMRLQSAALLRRPKANTRRPCTLRTGFQPPSLSCSEARKSSGIQENLRAAIAFSPHSCYTLMRGNCHTNIWGISTVGSALHSHCRGHRFESGMLHHKPVRNDWFFFVFGRFLQVCCERNAEM